MKKIIIVEILLMLVVVGLFSGCLEQSDKKEILFTIQIFSGESLKSLDTIVYEKQNVTENYLIDNNLIKNGRVSTNMGSWENWIEKEGKRGQLNWSNGSNFIENNITYYTLSNTYAFFYPRIIISSYGEQYATKYEYNFSYILDY